MIKLAIDAGKANPAPPIGPALGAKVMLTCIAAAECEMLRASLLAARAGGNNLTVWTVR
jgi:hypothetical protein